MDEFLKGILGGSTVQLGLIFIVCGILDKTLKGFKFYPKIKNILFMIVGGLTALLVPQIFNAENKIVAFILGAGVAVLGVSAMTKLFKQEVSSLVNVFKSDEKEEPEIVAEISDKKIKDEIEEVQEKKLNNKNN